MKLTILGCVVSALWLAGDAHSESAVEIRDWDQRFVVGDNPTLTIDNIWGDITLVAGDSGRIGMTIETRRSAENQTSFEQSKVLIPLMVDHVGNTVAVHVGTAHRTWLPQQQCDGCRLHANFTVTVPPGTTVNIETVNDGDISISGVTGVVSARNVNGSIAVDTLNQCNELTTINGQIVANFSKPPTTDCTLSTMNGDIDVTLPATSDVDFAIHSGNGKIRSDVALSAREHAATVEHRTDDGRHYYEIQQLAGLRMGNGGAILTMKTLNGDILVSRSKKQ